MYVLKGNAKNSTPNSSQTDEPRNTKICRYNLDPDLTPCAKVGLGRLMGSGATKSQLYIDLRGFPHFFSPSIPISTRNHGPIFVFDIANDVFPCVFVPPHYGIFPNPNLWGQLPPKNPYFPKIVIVACPQKWTCRPNQST
jgi:hypothetical protein